MNVTRRPSLIVPTGPNGAGKSTTGPTPLKDTLGDTEFVNADLIAQGLSPFAPEVAAIAAGRVMLARMRDLARRRITFAFETTLAGGTASFAPRSIAAGGQGRGTEISDPAAWEAISGEAQDET